MVSDFSKQLAALSPGEMGQQYDDAIHAALAREKALAARQGGDKADLVDLMLRVSPGNIPAALAALTSELALATGRMENLADLSVSVDLGEGRLTFRAYNHRPPKFG